MLLMLPFFLAYQLGGKWVEANLTVIIVSVSLPSLAAALWIARWVERRQSEEWVEIDGQGVTSTMRTAPHPDTKVPLNIEKGRKARRFLKARAMQVRRRVLWRDVRGVELRSRRSARIPGRHYRVCLIADDTILPIPLNDDVMGTRPMVEVNPKGRPLARHRAGEYPGKQLVQEIQGHVGDVPWIVKDVCIGKYDRKERELRFTGIEDPWAVETVNDPAAGEGTRRKRLVLAVIAAVLISVVAFSILFLYRSRIETERAKEEAFRKAKAKHEQKATEEAESQAGH
jgi:hypothetical protein